MTPERWRELSRIYHDALARDPRSREAFVREACGGDEALRGEVLSLLAQPTGDGFPALPSWALPPESVGRTEPGPAAASLAGRRFGPYLVDELIGAGGMGEVYRARDTTLGREVAIKVLPRSLASDPSRLARFEQEARLLAALNHPHVGAIYGVQEADGVRGLVLELVDGQTLAERLERGRLPLSETLALADQIADALDAAHARGIVHRDLKPANIKVRADGTLKLLDLGLAKMVASASDEDSLPTLARAAVSREGMVLGTPAYMSPEQARGLAVDKRTDIWAFGCVLYEMLAGRLAFAGKTASDTIAAILEREPDPAALPTALPPQIRWLLRRCLAKDPDARLRDIGDARHAIADAVGGEDRAWASGGGATPSRAGDWRRLALVALGLLAAAALAVAVWARRPSVRTGLPPLKLALAPPEGTSFRSFAVSPDGSRLALVAADSQDKEQLWVRALDSLRAEPLPGTEGARFPFWSPDGRSLGFFAGGKLKRIEVAGGPPQALCDALFGMGGSWGPDDVILFSPSTKDPIFQVSASGGVPKPVTAIDVPGQENSHRWPAFLPDGRHFLYGIRSHPFDQGGIYAGSLDGSVKVRLTGSSVFAPSTHAPGPGGKRHLLFVDRDTLLARELDTTRLELTGEPIRAAEHVRLFSVSERGLLVYGAPGRSRGTRLAWFDRSGRQVGTLGPPGEYVNVSLSPDGKRAAVDRVDTERGDTDIWILDVSSGQGSRLTTHPALDVTPVWSPDGSRVAFMSARSAPNTVYSRAASGAGADELLVRSVGNAWPFDWSRDGRYLLYYDTDPTTGRDLWVLPTTGKPTPMVVVRTNADEQTGQFSPDGRFIAYVSNETGRAEIYVRPFKTTGAQDSGWRISSGGGGSPRWRRDGRELFYLSQGRLMAVAVKTAPSFEAGAPVLLSEPPVATLGFLPYDVAPDGRRFLMTVDPDYKASPNLTVFLDWSSAASDTPR